MKEKPTGKILRTLRHRALTQHKQAEASSSSSSQNLGAAGRTQKHKAAEPSTSRQDTPGKTQHKRAEPRTQQQAAAGSSRQKQAAAGRTQQQQAEPSDSRQNPAAARRTQQQHAEPSASGQNRAQAGRFQQAQIPTAGDRTIQNLNMISFNGHASHRTIDNGITIKIAINTIQG